MATLLEDLVDAQLRKDFEPSTDGLDPLLTLWQEALGSETGVIEIGDEEAERLATASHHWREGIAGGFAAARTCLCLLYTSPSPRDQRGSRMPSSA